MSDDEDELIEATLSSAVSLKERLQQVPPYVIALALTLLISSVGLVAWSLDAFADEIEYKTIEFDKNSARTFAQNLVDLGHPEWGGRMSGSEEEMLTSESILDNFTKMGYSPSLETFDVPMFSIDSTPTLSYCKPGSLPINIAPCSGADVGAEFRTFEHRIDYVIQGYSGSIARMYNQNTPIVDLGRATDENIDWASADGAIIVIRAGRDSGNNSIVWENGPTNGALGAIQINDDSNCDTLVSGDCVPIFKAGVYSRIITANQGMVPTDFPMITMSKSAGEDLLDAFANDNARLSWEMKVDNDGQLPVRVPCGTHYGKTEELLIVGAHHDTVYNGPGAVDDTSGSASVLEMARQFSMLINQSGQADRTIKFCTWGGEEEGLWGSTAWVASHVAKLSANLRLYVNLDMNHADKEFRENGRLTLFMNYADDYEHVQAIADQYASQQPDIWNKYTVVVKKVAHEDMGRSSDHAGFVYDLNDGVPGRAAVCYGSGSWEYHTYLDDMTRFNEESLGISVVIYGTYIRYLAWDEM
jgi:hypothetical protein